MELVERGEGDGGEEGEEGLWVVEEELLHDHLTELRERGREGNLNAMAKEFSWWF